MKDAIAASTQAVPHRTRTHALLPVRFIYEPCYVLNRVIRDIRHVCTNLNLDGQALVCRLRRGNISFPFHAACHQRAIFRVSPLCDRGTSVRPNRVRTRVLLF